MLNTLPPMPTTGSTWRAPPWRCAASMTRWADFPGPLPAFTTNVERCHRLLADAAALPALAATDRHFLRTAYDHIMMRLDGLRIDRVPIHGDAGAHNVFMTPAGALYADFSDVCRGPREWDIGCLPDIDWAPFAPIDYGALV